MGSGLQQGKLTGIANAGEDGLGAAGRTRGDEYIGDKYLRMYILAFVVTRMIEWSTTSTKFRYPFKPTRVSFCSIDAVCTSRQTHVYV